jgi:hypothetical protein
MHAPTSLKTAPSSEQAPPHAYSDEDKRIASLMSYEIFREGPDPTLDALTRMGAALYQTPICAITLLWLSARIMNLQTGTIQIMANPELAKGVEIPDL